MSATWLTPSRISRAPATATTATSRGVRAATTPRNTRNSSTSMTGRGRGLAPLAVLAGAVLDLLPGRRLPADQHPGGVHGPQPLADPLHRPVVDGPAQPVLQLDPDQHPPRGLARAPRR